MAQNNLKFTISAVDRTKNAFGLVKRGLGGLTSAVFNFKTALAGALGVGGLGLLVKNSLEATDRIGKLSNTIGISTKDLQTFKLASEIGGLELETFARGIRRFTDNIGDFKIGIGEAKVSLEALGITQEDVLAVENDQVALLGLVADALNQVEDGAIKTKLALEIFGGRGVELLNVLKGGTAQLRAFAEESERFGALTEPQIRAVEDFNDSVVRLQTVFFNLVNQIVANLTPALLDLSENLREKLLVNLDDSTTFSKNFALSLIDTAEAVALFSTNLIVAGKNVGIFFENVKDLFDFSKFIENLRTGKKFKAFEELNKDLSPELVNKFDLMRESINSITDKSKDLGDNMKTVGLNTEESEDKFNVLEDRLKRLRDTSQKFGDTIAQGLERGVFEGQKLTETLRQIGQEIIKIAFRKSITEPVGTAIGGAVRGVFTDILKGLPGRADGGSVTAGQPYMVGERGKELFIPGRSGTIIPNHALGGGSVTVNQTINLMPSVTDSIRGEILNALPLIREQSVQAVIEARSRGGVLTKAMGLK